MRADHRESQPQASGGGRLLLLLGLLSLLLLPPRRLPHVRLRPRLRPCQGARLAAGRAGQLPGEDPRLLHALRIIYRARVTSGVLTHEVGGSTDQAAWEPLEQVAELGEAALVQVGLEMAIRTPACSE